MPRSSSWAPTASARPQLPQRPESFAGLVRVARRVSLQGLSADEVEAYLAT